MVSGANQPNGDVNTNATKHYDRDAFETNNSGNDLHGVAQINLMVM